MSSAIHFVMSEDSDKKICERCKIEFNRLSYIDHICISDND